MAAVAAGPTLEDRLTAFAAWADTALGDEGWSNLLLALGVGLGLQRAVDHDLPVRTLTDVVRVMSTLRSPRPDPGRS